MHALTRFWSYAIAERYSEIACRNNDRLSVSYTPVLHPLTPKQK